MQARRMTAVTLVLAGLSVGSAAAVGPEGSRPISRIPAVATPTSQRPLLHFEPNLGQTDGSVEFTARARGMQAFFLPGETVFALHSPFRTESDGDAPDDEVSYTTDFVRMRFIGADPWPETVARDRQAGASNYFIGNDPDWWVTEVPHFGAVVSEGIYPGIDLHWRGGTNQALAYDLVVTPGADPGEIAFELEGALSMSIAESGELRVETANGELRHSRPVIFQQVDEGRRSVPGRFVRLGALRVGFEVGPYLVEVKATTRSPVRLTPKQAATAASHADRYDLCVVDLREIDEERLDADWTGADVAPLASMFDDIGGRVHDTCVLVNRARASDVGIRNESALRYEVPVEVWDVGTSIADWVAAVSDEPEMRDG